MIEDKYRCCGCGACAAICSHNAIKMVRDTEGFMYPMTDYSQCVGCGKCEEVCAFRYSQHERNCVDEPLDEGLEIYVGRHNNENVVEESRSGGIFTALSDIILENEGYVYGVVVDENMEVVHIGTNSPCDRDKMRGSKYVQSKIGVSVYNEIKQKIQQGRKILFTGTSCQIAAVKKYFEGNDENIFYVDIVCHGVVSPLVYKEYLNMMMLKSNSNIRQVDFRNKKKYGWKDHVETVYFDGNDEGMDSVVFRNIFYSLNATRPSCSKCPYKTQYHPGDITIADCWGIESVAKEYDDNKGCSLIFVNSKKGKELFSKIQDDIDVKKTYMCRELFQMPLHKAYEVNEEKRKKFWNEFLTDSDYVLKKYDN